MRIKLCQGRAERPIANHRKIFAAFRRRIRSFASSESGRAWNPSISSPMPGIPGPGQSEPKTTLSAMDGAERDESLPVFPRELGDGAIHVLREAHDFRRDVVDEARALNADLVQVVEERPRVVQEPRRPLAFGNLPPEHVEDVRLHGAVRLEVYVGVCDAGQRPAVAQKAGNPFRPRREINRDSEAAESLCGTPGTASCTVGRPRRAARSRPDPRCSRRGWSTRWCRNPPRGRRC